MTYQVIDVIETIFKKRKEKTNEWKWKKKPSPSWKETSFAL